MKTAILGFGNPVRSDDAIGVYLAAISEIKINMELSDTVKEAGDRLITIILNDL